VRDSCDSSSKVVVVAYGALLLRKKVGGAKEAVLTEVG